MTTLLRYLVRNLTSGARMVFGRPVTLVAFRISVAQLIALLAVSALLDIGLDALRAAPGAEFTVTGLVGEGFFGALLMLFAALLSLAFRQPAYALALPVIVLSGEWPLQLARMGITAAVRGDPTLFAAGVRAEQVVLAWTLFWLWRAAAVSLAPRRPQFWLRSLAAAAVLASPLWFANALLPGEGWWRSSQQVASRDARYPSPVSEAALAAQPQLLADAIDGLDDERPGITDLYFVGFAPYAAEDVFRKDMEVARDLFDDRFDTDGRSILLINNPRTVLDEPLATVSNLRETLKAIGGGIDPDDDVVMLYLEGHGSADRKLAAEFPPLELDALTPESLRDMLDDAGIKWRIIVVSACYSGGWIEPLKDEHTLIMTASAANRRSFGCGTGSDATYFGDALFQHALRFEDSFVKAFEQARERIAERERTEHVSPPSNPQIYFGTEMAAKLPKLEATLRARRTGQSI
jgi:hypothetical protein